MIIQLIKFILKKIRWFKGRKFRQRVGIGDKKRHHIIPPMKEFFDHGKNRWITSKKQIKEIEKSENKTFGSDKEINQETDYQKKQRINQWHSKVNSKIKKDIIKYLER